MKWVLIVVGFLAGLVALAAVIGLLLPKEHKATKTLHLKRPPAEVWAAITGYGSMAQWRTNLARVERLPDRDGKQVWKEVTKDGWELPLAEEVVEPPRRLVRRIADPSLPFGGNWTYEIEPAADGCSITITENGEVSNPLFRLMSRLTDQSANIVQFLQSLAAKFGEPANLR